MGAGGEGVQEERTSTRGLQIATLDWLSSPRSLVATTPPSTQDLTHEPTASYHPRTPTTLYFRLCHPHRPPTARVPPPPLPRLLPLSATTTPR
ncbi:hypothetical protein CPC08DRAFT_717310 [Agrocybe pediades]|nr:hypothetical protein CPC08DRAFT_717310 [Agrocybe pediades]